ncbi:MAG: UDP-2,3-diacylglucosamine diphosphatase [Zoogloea sp.]|nr:UDP-2,3-diacylglucosamine diphosphatase [Zoogloea sp.]
MATRGRAVAETIHFISDLHLSSDRPALAGLFERYLSEIAPTAAGLYILGDLFEYWAGDDDLAEPFNARMCAALATLAARGTRVRFQVGNRDFLASAGFAAAAGLELIPDPCPIDLDGSAMLLAHGDALCTDDQAYQAFRRQVRDPQWQAGFLTQPLAVRKQIIAGVRMQSEASKQEKASSIMDVNAEAVASLLREHGYPRLIHGHTHRPATHLFEVDGHACERWVLADWHDERGEYLEWNGAALTRHAVLQH